MPRRRQIKKWKKAKADRKAAAKDSLNHSLKAVSGAFSGAKPKAASRPACHFLRIPLGEKSVGFMCKCLYLTLILEVRHKIYGYLLLDPPSAFLRPDNTPQDEDIDSNDWTSDSSDYCSLDFDDEMLALSNFNPYGIEMGDMSDGMFNEVYNGGGIAGFGCDMFGDFDDQSDTMDFGSPDLPFSTFFDDGEENDNEGTRASRFLGKPLPTKLFEKETGIKRHLAILRTNRQIYIEASDLLHSDLTIVVQPGDALIDTPGNASVKPSKKLWRHAPSSRIHSTKLNGQTVYTTPSLDGVLEPHVFAQFRKISYLGVFEFFDNGAPSLHINNDLRARAEDEAKFVSYLTAAKSTTRWCEDPLPAGRHDNGRRQTLQDVADITISRVVVTQPSMADVIQKFVDLLSNSPVIRHLEFSLNVVVKCSSSSESMSTDSDQDAECFDKEIVADERATELFLEAGILDPLRNLSNVMDFSLTIETDGRASEFMEPKEKHLKMIQDLKNVIERNWIVKHGPH